MVDNDPTIAALKAAAKAEGFLRFQMWELGPVSFSGDDKYRLNVNFEKAPDGSPYRIAKFSIG